MLCNIAPCRSHGTVSLSRPPFRWRQHGHVDHDRYASHVRLAGRVRVRRRRAQRFARRIPDAERRRACRRRADCCRGGTRRVHGRAGCCRLRRGRSDRRLRWARRPLRRAADAVMLLPPNTYRADERAVVEHYRTVAAVGLPGRRLQQPVSTPRSTSRPSCSPGCTARGSIVAVKEFTGDVRRTYQIAELAPGLDVLAGADDVALELAIGRRARAGSPASRTRFPRAASSSGAAARGRRPGRGRAAVPRAAPAAAVGLAHRVRPGDQAEHGRRGPIRRAVPAAASAAERRAGR